jgi:hypothetical protein
MTEQIQTCKFIDFIKIAHKNKIDFAKIMLECGAATFLGIDFSKPNYPYVIKKELLDESSYCKYPYYVTYYPYKSYVMFEISERILLWVGFTEVKERKKGYMTQLFKSIIEQFSNKEVVGDSHDKNMIQICESLKIKMHKD